MIKINTHRKNLLFWIESIRIFIDHLSTFRSVSTTDIIPSSVDNLPKSHCRTESFPILNRTSLWISVTSFFDEEIQKNSLIDIKTLGPFYNRFSILQKFSSFGSIVE